MNRICLVFQECMYKLNRTLAWLVWLQWFELLFGLGATNKICKAYIRINYNEIGGFSNSMCTRWIGVVYLEYFRVVYGMNRDMNLFLYTFDRTRLNDLMHELGWPSISLQMIWMKLMNICSWEGVILEQFLL